MRVLGGPGPPRMIKPSVVPFGNSVVPRITWFNLTAQYATLHVFLYLCE